MRELTDSGVEWVGVIPTTWSMRQAGQLADQTKTPNEGLKETNLLSLSYGKVKRKDINTTEGLLPASFETYNIVQEGDIVLRFTDLQNDQKSLRVGRAVEKGIITSAYVTIRPFERIDSRYLYYALHSYDLRKGFYGMGAGVRQGLKWQEAKYIQIPWPTMAERARIADYLDDKCAEIDRAIEAAEKSIEEYKLLFSSEIEQMFRTVSGRTKMTRVSTLITDGDHQAPPRSDEGVPFLVISNISSGHIDFTDTDFVSEEYYLSIAEEQRPQKGDLLVTVTGSYGIPVVVDNDRAFCFQRHIALVRPSIDVQYLRYALKTQDFKRYCDQVVTGAAQKTLTLTHLRAYRVQLATESQQKLIAAKLADCELQIDRAIAAKQAIIADLKAYKQSLIYEVVTGKREV